MKCDPEKVPSLVGSSNRVNLDLDVQIDVQTEGRREMGSVDGGRHIKPSTIHISYLVVKGGH